MSLPLVTTHRARKERPCEAKVGCTIAPGESYQREVWPPWALVVDDPEPPYSPLGHWETRAFHGACEMDRLYGTNLVDDPWEPEGGYPKTDLF